MIEGGADPTPIIDRFYFRSIYFREPSGVLFEIATMGPGFSADEPQEHLGERLSLPPAFEHLRAQVEANLTPLPNPREVSTVTYLPRIVRTKHAFLWLKPRIVRTIRDVGGDSAAGLGGSWTAR